MALLGPSKPQTLLIPYPVSIRKLSSVWQECTYGAAVPEDLAPRTLFQVRRLSTTSLASPSGIHLGGILLYSVAHVQQFF